MSKLRLTHLLNSRRLPGLLATCLLAVFAGVWFGEIPARMDSREASPPVQQSFPRGVGSKQITDKVYFGGQTLSHFILPGTVMPLAATAVYDSVLKAPKCGSLDSSCDSGTLLNGRDNISGGAEPNQPNTINNSCADGTAGTYQFDESIDKIKVSTLDASNLAPGKTAKIEVTLWAYSFFTSDHLDLYYAADASNPSWIYITTLEPSAAGAQVLSTTYTLPFGATLQAVRARFRYQGAPSSCGTGSFDDYDDLIFGAWAESTVSGRITNGTGSGLSGRTVTLTGTPGTFTSAPSNGNGDYIVTAPRGYSYTATANGPGESFVRYGTPNSSITPLSGNVTNFNFAKNTPQYTASGTITLTGGGDVTSVTVFPSASGHVSPAPGQCFGPDSAGHFDCFGLWQDTTYSIVPSKGNYVFTPSSVGVSNNVFNLQFTGNPTATATTATATAIGLTTATLNGSANPNGTATTARFEWGTDPTLTTNNLTPSQAVGSGTSDQAFSQNLTGLVAGTDYYFRAVASNSLGDVRGLIVPFATGPPGTADYDGVLKAPKCGSLGKACNSGTLLNGRDTILNGPEPNQPNTINNSCADGTSGTYHSDESIDAIKVSTQDASTLAPGKTVLIEVTVWPFGPGFASDHLDLYYASDASNPNWIYINTKTPSTTGAQVLFTTYALPTGASLQAVRARFRFGGLASPCGASSNFEDYDDLIFAVQNSAGATISGRVADGNQGLSGRFVSVSGSPGTFSALTNGNGDFVISGVPVGFNYSAVARHSSDPGDSSEAFVTYGQGSVSLTPLTGDVSNLNFAKSSPQYDVSGSVSPSAAADATITCTSTNTTPGWPDFPRTTTGVGQLGAWSINVLWQGSSYSCVATKQNYTFNPSFYTVTGNATALTFTGTLNPVQVTVQTNPAGRSISIDGGSTVTAPQVVQWTPGSSHTIATTTPQAGAAGTQYVWTSWSDGGAISHTVAPSVDTTYTANFTTQYQLTMSAGAGGSVSPPSSFFNSGQSVQITATPNSGFSFTGWTGTGTGSFSGSTNPVSVTMNGPITETASFTQIPPGTVQFNGATYSKTEDGGTATITVTRTGGSFGAASVQFSNPAGGTATGGASCTAGVDYITPSGTLNWADGDAADKTFAVTICSDSTVESNETVNLSLSNATGAALGSQTTATLTITNDDTDVTVAVSPLSVAEDVATNLVYTFTRTGVTTGALTVNFSVGGTATFNTDYTQSGAPTFSASSGTVTIGAGNSTATVTIDPSVDSTVEPDETAILTVTSGTGYNVGVPSSATGTITNDDTDVTVAVSPLSVAEDVATNLVYTFTRTGVTTGALTVNFSVGGTATFSTDYTQIGAAAFSASSGTVSIGAGNSTATVTIDPSVDSTVEPDETAILTVTSGTGYNVGSTSSATGTITNDDGGGLRIDTITPPAGRTSGGQQIVLAGAFAGLSTVTMGGTAASWVYTNGAGDTSSITVTTPAHAVGAVQIDLTPTSGSPYSKVNAFAYLPTVFTDNTITVGQTTAKAQHILELRQAVDAMRAVAGLAPAPWTDATLSPASSLIKAIHIQELRTYLDDAATRLGYTPSPYTDPSLTTGYLIKRIHVEELRQRIRVIAG